MMEGESEEASEVASIVTVRIVPNLFCPPGLRGGSSRLENIVVLVRLLNACD